MSTDMLLTTASPLSPKVDLPTTATTHDRHALRGDKAPPLGGKAMALQRRRRSHQSARCLANLNTLGEVTVSNADATLAFRLLPVPPGLLIDRVQHHVEGHVLRQTLVLNQQQFETWCSLEPLRLEEPGTWARLRRCADAALSARA